MSFLAGYANAIVGLVVPGLLASIACAAGRQQPGQSPNGPPPVDSVVFGLIVARERAGTTNAHMEFDPRPLVSNPSLVAVQFSTGIALAEIGVTAPVRDAFDTSAVQVAAARRRVLERLNIAVADVSAFPDCPGFLRAPSPTVIEQRQRLCPPGDVQRITALSQPRPGGPSSPNDMSQTENLPDAWSVRRITRQMGAKGAATYSADYVLRRNSSGSWVIDRVVELAFIE